MIYQFKMGSHLYGDAQPVGERLEAIRTRHDGLVPEAVVEDARSSKSPLHPYFEWDDARAAERYRLDQAGHLIRCVTVIVEPQSTEQAAEHGTMVRAFMPVQKQTGERVYEATATALSDTEYRRQVLAQAYSELGAVARKYRELKELAEVVTALDRVGDLLSEERLTQES